MAMLSGADLSPRRSEAHPPAELSGTSSVVRACLAQIDAAADGRHVLLVAEHGLDATAVARYIHARSDRCEGPFVAPSLDGSAASVERELFGNRAMGPAGDSDPISPSSALFRANNGVLLVSGIGELPMPVQRRLARILRASEARVGRKPAPVPLDVRLIATTESRLDAGVRDELARRFTSIIEIPPLRERREDVPALAEAMLAAPGEARRFTPAALTVLAALPWRRNIAELAALIERLTRQAGAGPIRQEDVLAEAQLDRTPSVRSGSLREARRQFEREYIASVLRAHEWQMREAARALGMERANLYRKARQLGIPLRQDPVLASRIDR